MVRGVKVKRAYEHKTRPMCASNLIRVCYKLRSLNSAVISDATWVDLHL